MKNSEPIIIENNETFNNLVRAFSIINGVDAIMLGGSRAEHTHDVMSDYDIYIYTNREIPLEERKQISDRYCDYMELNNQFWEMEDNGILKETKIPIDIIYRSLDWIEKSLDRLLFQYIADIGYTTAIWFNFINSKILYDTDGRATRMKEKYSIAYPNQLKESIIAKNLPLLRDQLPAYIFQIEKAIKRNDLVSINHRLSALFASYFDILFAINELPHPGEKRIIEYLEDNAKYIPNQMSDDVNRIIQTAIAGESKVSEIINDLIDRLEVLI